MKKLLIALLALTQIVLAKPITVKIVNKSYLSTKSINRYVDAQRIQLKRDFTPIWGIEANLVTEGPADMSMEIHNDILDFLPDGVFDLIMGFHTADGFGLVGIVESSMAGTSWTHTASHELLEMLENPKALNGPHEVCDPVSPLYYNINGVRLSDFVYPNYYFSGGIAPFDALGKIKKPFKPVEGGYNSF